MASRGQPIFFILIKIENINICLVTNRVRLQKDYSPLCVGSICLTCLQRARTCLWRLGKILPTEEKNDEQCLIEYTFLYCQISNKHTQWNKFKSLEYAFLVKLFNPWVGRGYTFWTIRSVKSIKSAPMVNVHTRGEKSKRLLQIWHFWGSKLSHTKLYGLRLRWDQRRSYLKLRQSRLLLLVLGLQKQK